MKARHELKHYINIADYTIIQSRIKYVATVDKNANANNEYKIRSLYFDDYNDKALLQKLTGINNRDKYRIRLYNDDDSFIRLEKKSKIDKYTHKVSSQISKEQVEKILANDLEFLMESKNKLFNELYYEMKTFLLKPKTIVDYTREAYIYKPGNVRVTFDKSIRTGINSVDIFNKNLPTIESLDSNQIVLEVKFDDFLPELIADVIQLGERTKTSISKYVLCRKYY